MSLEIHLHPDNDIVCYYGNDTNRPSFQDADCNCGHNTPFHQEPRFQKKFKIASHKNFTPSDFHGQTLYKFSDFSS